MSEPPESIRIVHFLNIILFIIKRYFVTYRYTSHIALEIFQLNFYMWFDFYKSKNLTTTLKVMRTLLLRAIFQRKSENTNPCKIQFLIGTIERDVLSVSRATLHFMLCNFITILSYVIDSQGIGYIGHRMFIGPCIIIIVEELETNLMSLVIFITLNICSTCFEH